MGNEWVKECCCGANKQDKELKHNTEAKRKTLGESNDIKNEIISDTDSLTNDSNDEGFSSTNIDGNHSKRKPPLSDPMETSQFVYNAGKTVSFDVRKIPSMGKLPPMYSPMSVTHTMNKMGKTGSAPLWSDDDSTKRLYKYQPRTNIAVSARARSQSSHARTGTPMTIISASPRLGYMPTFDDVLSDKSMDTSNDDKSLWLSYFSEQEKIAKRETKNGIKHNKNKYKNKKNNKYRNGKTTKNGSKNGLHSNGTHNGNHIKLSLNTSSNDDDIDHSTKKKPKLNKRRLKTKFDLKLRKIKKYKLKDERQKSFILLADESKRINLNCIYEYLQHCKVNNNITVTNFHPSYTNVIQFFKYINGDSIQEWITFSQFVKFIDDDGDIVKAFTNFMNTGHSRSQHK